MLFVIGSRALIWINPAAGCVQRTRKNPPVGGFYLCAP
jgi:hypothetical protein